MSSGHELNKSITMWRPCDVFNFSCRVEETIPARQLSASLDFFTCIHLKSATSCAGEDFKTLTTRATCNDCWMPDWSSFKGEVCHHEYRKEVSLWALSLFECLQQPVCYHAGNFYLVACKSISWPGVQMWHRHRVIIHQLILKPRRIQVRRFSVRKCELSVAHLVPCLSWNSSGLLIRLLLKFYIHNSPPFGCISHCCLTAVAMNCL